MRFIRNGFIALLLFLSSAEKISALDWNQEIFSRICDGRICWTKSNTVTESVGESVTEEITVLGKLADGSLGYFIFTDYKTGIPEHEKIKLSIKAVMCVKKQFSESPSDFKEVKDENATLRLVPNTGDAEPSLYIQLENIEKPAIIPGPFFKKILFGSADEIDRILDFVPAG